MTDWREKLDEWCRAHPPYIFGLRDTSGSVPYERMIEILAKLEDGEGVNSESEMVEPD